VFSVAAVWPRGGEGNRPRFEDSLFFGSAIMWVGILGLGWGWDGSKRALITLAEAQNFFLHKAHIVLIIEINSIEFELRLKLLK
jgi:hypothetical protein